MSFDRLDIGPFGNNAVAALYAAMASTAPIASPLRSLSPPRAAPILSLPDSCKPPNGSSSTEQLVWIIFGATGHIGRNLVRTALSKGDLVTAVAWTQEYSEAEIAQWSGERFLWLRCDVRFRESVEEVIARSIKQWGRVDLVTNCVAFGVVGACEDQDDNDVRTQFDINFFGTLHVIQSLLPYFRSQSKGRYIIFSGASGALGIPGLGPYSATKCAVEGLIESMLYEVDNYNIKATLVQPSHVRQDEPEQSLDASESLGYDAIKSVKPPAPFPGFRIKPSSEPYAGANAPAGHAKRMFAWLNTRQPTSAMKSAELVWQLGHCEYPPLRLLLGAFAVDSNRDRLKSAVEEVRDWKHLHFPSVSSDQEYAAEDHGSAAFEHGHDDDYDDTSANVEGDEYGREYDD